MSNRRGQFSTERQREIGVAVLEARRHGERWKTLAQRYDRSIKALRRYAGLIGARGPKRFSAPPFRTPARIITRLRYAAGRFVPTMDLVDFCYGDYPCGGPDDATNAVKQHIHLLRRRGFPIIGRAWHGYRYVVAEAA